MAQDADDRNGRSTISRRGLITAMGAAAPRRSWRRGSRAATPPAGPMAPPSTVTTPRDFGPNAPPNVYFTDPDVLTVEPEFNGLRQPNAPIQRLWTGALVGGPAWNSQGRYLLWSDIRTIASCGGWRTTERSACSGRRPTTATAIPSTSRGGSFPASTSPGAWCVTRTDGSAPLSLSA